MQQKTLSFPFHLKESEDDGWFAGYASVFEVLDQHNEKVMRGAFAKTLDTWRQTNKFPKMLWQHDPQRPLGIWKKVQEDQHGLWVEGQLLLDLQQAREAYSLLKKGVIDALSIGFTVGRARLGYLSKTRVLEEVHLHEISLVTFAANPYARVTACKGQREGLILEKLKDLKIKLESEAFNKT